MLSFVNVTVILPWKHLILEFASETEVLCKKSISVNLVSPPVNKLSLS